jgi:hypothetical protein
MCAGTFHDNYDEQRLEELAERKRQTCLERYGVDSVNKLKSKKDAAANTMIKKYGVDNPAKIKEAKEKTRQTCLQKYGSTTYMQSTDFKKKTQSTLQNKYGVDNAAKSVESRAKSRETFANKDLTFWRERAIRASESRSKLESINGIKPDSLWETHFIERHPGCTRGPAIKYNHNGKERTWLVDFEWNGILYEIKAPWTLRDPMSRSSAKMKISNQLGIRWYMWDPGTHGTFEEEEELSKIL